MSPALSEARAARDAARAALDARLLRLRGDPEVATTGQHLMGRVREEADAVFDAVFDEAIDVAMESKGIIAGTLALLALWFLRHPVIAWIAALGDDDAGDGDEFSTDEAQADD